MIITNSNELSTYKCNNPLCNQIFYSNVGMNDTCGMRVKDADDKRGICNGKPEPHVEPHVNNYDSAVVEPHINMYDSVSDAELAR